jgi:L-alanine-DL-glutamate epimerase-like enolase superfamily enzyme
VVCEVQVEVDGIRAVGQGSAAETVAVTGEDATSIQEAINGPVRTALSAAGADGLTGFSARIGSALPGATSAKAAVDVALHDAVARATGVSLAELLGAPAGTVDSFTIEDDMTVSLEDPQVMATRAREAGDAGYRILKIKLGSDVEEDRRRLDAVLDAVPGARLRLDANQGWEVDQAIEILHRLERDGLPIDLVEQPVDRRDLTGMAQVRAAVGIPVMADESLWSPEDARRIVELGAATPRGARDRRHRPGGGSGLHDRRDDGAAYLDHGGRPPGSGPSGDHPRGPRFPAVVRDQRARRWVHRGGRVDPPQRRARTGTGAAARGRVRAEALVAPS